MLPLGLFCLARIFLPSYGAWRRLESTAAISTGAATAATLIRFAAMVARITSHRTDDARNFHRRLAVNGLFAIARCGGARCGQDGDEQYHGDATAGETE